VIIQINISITKTLTNSGDSENIMAEVLVVEDSILTRTILTNIMTENGHHVTEAVDGNDAISKYFKSRPDLVLMDLLMPEKDGLTAIKEIIDKDPNAKIIVCSADVQDFRVLEAIEAGASDYITKPFDNKKITDVTEKCLKSAALEEMQHDIITERAIMKDIIKNGIQRSIQALSKMTNRTIKASISDFRLIPPSDISNNLTEECIGVNYSFTGSNNGYVYLLIPKQNAYELNNILMENTVTTDDNTVISVFNEIGNIYINSFLSTFSDLLDIRMSFGIPKNVDQKMISGMLELIQFKPSHAQAFFIKGKYSIDTIEFIMYLIIYSDITAAAYKYDLREGTNYLVVESTENKSYDMFGYMIKRGYQGICITRKHPEELRKETCHENLPMVWLGADAADNIQNCICTTSIPKIVNIIQSFLKKTNKNILLIDNIKYLVDTNSIGIVTGFIEEMKMINIQQKGILIISYDPSLFDTDFINQNDFIIIDNDHGVG
jgi:two-component system chemotaxis response regulator CheY